MKTKMLKISTLLGATAIFLQRHSQRLMQTLRAFASSARKNQTALQFR